MSSFNSRHAVGMCLLLLIQLLFSSGEGSVSTALISISATAASLDLYKEVRGCKDITPDLDNKINESKISKTEIIEKVEQVNLEWPPIEEKIAYTEQLYTDVQTKLSLQQKIQKLMIEIESLDAQLESREPVKLSFPPITTQALKISAAFDGAIRSAKEDIVTKASVVRTSIWKNFEAMNFVQYHGSCADKYVKAKGTVDNQIRSKADLFSLVHDLTDMTRQADEAYDLLWDTFVEAASATLAKGEETEQFMQATLQKLQKRVNALQALRQKKAAKVSNMEPKEAQIPDVELNAPAKVPEMEQSAPGGGK